MKLFIPTIRTELELTTKWVFSLYHEYRNEKLWKWLGRGEEHNPWGGSVNKETGRWEFLSPIEVSLPKGTILVVDRIYIRNNASNYDSVTFRLKSCPRKNGKARFWAKLADVNTMNVKVI